MRSSDKQKNKTDGGVSWWKKHFSVLLITAGILLIVFSVKTQTVLLTDQKQECTVQLEYTMFGYCISANPMTDTARDIATEHIFFLGGMDATVRKAAAWINEHTGEQGVKVYTSGYPRGNAKLNRHICDMLAAEGITAEPFEA